MVDTELRWTLEGLVAQVARALAIGDYRGAGNRRVQDVPDVRAVRYYTTLGLLDRPFMKGRTAFYGVRHVRQLVAIKKLQAAGQPLAQIQTELSKSSDKELIVLSGLAPEHFEKEQSDEFSPSSSTRKRAFWTEAPPIDPTPQETGIPGGPPLSEPAPTGLPPSTNVPPASMHGLKLGDHAMLLLTGVRAPDTGDLAAIAAVAAPLLTLLEERGLVAPKGEKK